jgi:hypothetical protein
VSTNATKGQAHGVDDAATKGQAHGVDDAAIPTT